MEMFTYFTCMFILFWICFALEFVLKRFSNSAKGKIVIHSLLLLIYVLSSLYSYSSGMKAGEVIVKYSANLNNPHSVYTLPSVMFLLSGMFLCLSLCEMKTIIKEIRCSRGVPQK